MTSSKHGVYGINYATSGLFGQARSYLEAIFKGVLASDQLPKENEIQTRSAYIVNVGTHDKQSSHWLSVFVENDQCKVFDSYGLSDMCSVRFFTTQNGDFNQSFM